MNKHLVAKWFLATKEAPELGVNRCLEYINLVLYKIIHNYIK